MKYKRQFATGALAISLLISGTNVFAASPQDLGIKNTELHQKQSKVSKNKIVGRNKNVGTIGSINSAGFVLEIKNLRKKSTLSVDVIADNTVKYNKNGAPAGISDLSVGQKVIVTGNLDKSANTLAARTVKIVG